MGSPRNRKRRCGPIIMWFSVAIPRAGAIGGIPAAENANGPITLFSVAGLILEHWKVFSPQREAQRRFSVAGFMLKRSKKSSLQAEAQMRTRMPVQCGKLHTGAHKRHVHLQQKRGKVQRGKCHHGALKRILPATEGADAVPCCKSQGYSCILKRKNNSVWHASGALGGSNTTAESTEAVQCGEPHSVARQGVTTAAMKATAVQRGKVSSWSGFFLQPMAHMRFIAAKMALHHKGGSVWQI